MKHGAEHAKGANKGNVGAKGRQRSELVKRKGQCVDGHREWLESSIRCRKDWI